MSPTGVFIKTVVLILLLVRTFSSINVNAISNYHSLTAEVLSGRDPENFDSISLLWEVVFVSLFFRQIQ